MRNTPFQRIAIVGPGALGCLLAATLSRIRGDIWMLDYDSQRAALLQRSGLILERAGKLEHCPVQVTADAHQIGPVSLVLLCVKSPALRQTIPYLSPLLTKNTLLLAWQNGISHLPVLVEAGLPGPVALAVTSMGAYLPEAGRVRFGGAGATSLGFIDEVPQTAKLALLEAAEFLQAAGLEVLIEADILVQIWNKLLVNVGINALSAIHHCKNGELLRQTELFGLLQAAVLEAARVAMARGIAIAPDPVARVIAVCRATADNISSMLQDVRQNRKTEIEAINGAVLEEARIMGISTPVNAELFATVKALEKTYLPK